MFTNLIESLTLVKMTEYRKSKTPQHPLQALKRDSTSSLILAADMTVRLLGEINKDFRYLKNSLQNGNYLLL